MAQNALNLCLRQNNGFHVDLFQVPRRPLFFRVLSNFQNFFESFSSRKCVSGVRRIKKLELNHAEFSENQFRTSFRQLWTVQTVGKRINELWEIRHVIPLNLSTEGCNSFVNVLKPSRENQRHYKSDGVKS